MVNFLVELGYLRHADPFTLTNECIGLKGMLATEINEGHPILMTELYVAGTLHSLTGDELVCVLACFQEKKDKERMPSLSELSVTTGIREALQHIQCMARDMEALEQKVGYPIEGYWNTSTTMVEPIRRWMEGEHASVLCAEYELFEGNFMRCILKLANIVEEWLSLAMYCQHTDQIEKVNEVKSRLLRDLVSSDSLYLRL